MLDTVSGSLPPSFRWVRDRYMEAVKTSLGAEAFEAARVDGRAMAAAQAIALARQQVLLLP
jgi:hypothetical protein